MCPQTKNMNHQQQDELDHLLLEDLQLSPADEESSLDSGEMNDTFPSPTSNRMIIAADQEVPSSLSSDNDESFSFSNNNVDEEEEETSSSSSSSSGDDESYRLESATNINAATRSTAMALLQQHQPTYLDVICGRGKRIQRHAGNRRFHQIIDANRTRYLQAAKKDKTQITYEIIHAIRSDGGRFLQLYSSGQYMDVGDDVARDKVSHALRTIRTKKAPRHKPRRKPRRRVVQTIDTARVESLLETQRRIYSELVLSEHANKSQEKERE